MRSDGNVLNAAPPSLSDRLEGDGREALGAIVESAGRVVDAILAHRRSTSLTADDAAEIRGTVMLRLVGRLMRRSPESEAVEQPENLAATLTFHAINDHLRERFPQRARLRARLRYVLRHHPRLAIWEAGVVVSGLATWQGRSAVAGVESSFSASGAMLDPAHPGNALTALFESIGQPVRFEELVGLMAEVWHVVDVPAMSAEEVAETRPSAASQLEDRQYLDRVWQEIGQLPASQRMALLLNLREEHSGNVLAFWVLTKVTTFEEVAESVGMTEEELAALWGSLPLADETIAARLGVSRQKVINLRHAGRRRLRRRMTVWEHGGHKATGFSS